MATMEVTIGAFKCFKLPSCMKQKAQTDSFPILMSFEEVT